jgi:hypothetical protein
MILIFISTPTVLLNIIKENAIVDTSLLTDSAPPASKDNYFDYLIKSFLPPLIIIGINRLLLIIITLLCWLISALGEPTPNFIIPKEHPQPFFFLYFLQHSNRSWSCCARWNQHIQNSQRTTAELRHTVTKFLHYQNG